MSNVISITDRNVLLDNDITNEVAEIIGQEKLQLPTAQSPLVDRFVSKIEGNYDTSRAKTDTDHAISLLYIAYNTTPQEHGDIRVKISRIMSQLVEAQQDSERRIKDSVRIAAMIGKQLASLLPDWLDVRDSADPEEIKQFVKAELLDMAKRISTAAMDVRSSLNTIIVKYDSILKDIKDVTDSSEIALSETIAANKAIEEEIVQATARKEELDSLVSALQEQIARFEKMAVEYGKQAQSAEQKSFWASVVKSVTQVVSAVLPIAAMAATGGVGGALGAAAAGTPGLLGNSNVDPKQVVEKSNLEAARNAQAKIVEARQQRADELEQQQAAATTDAERQELSSALEKAQGELREEQNQLSQAENQLGAFLRQLGAAADEAGAEQQRQGASLRELERQMLDNVEKYEEVKRGQVAELAKITVLLDAKRSEEQTIELAVRSLNLSVSALKRSKEIVEEIAFFFKSFADFMQCIVDEATVRMEEYEKAGNSEVLRKSRLEAIRLSTDEFFVSQAAEWLAVGVVSERFAQLFNDGWSKLNKLSGQYITGDELQAYLVQASQQLKVIIEEREAASNQRIASLQNYRQEREATA
ncbi:tyrosyl-tRNA deacylase [Pseudomonas putida]|uniref:Tyrosyl-tRNA deacylase n=1 Tax=Pseudomonas putida TaxID=303 RepID=A0A6I6XL55_PSEPU|nr:tyrosyl-tRNA deacylase [Pseudomonas putida]QHG64596.2 tyrosyl-tRNA deacylase [Pseudomonas putida]